MTKAETCRRNHIKGVLISAAWNCWPKELCLEIRKGDTVLPAHASPESSGMQCSWAEIKAVHSFNKPGLIVSLQMFNGSQHPRQNNVGQVPMPSFPASLTTEASVTLAYRCGAKDTKMTVAMMASQVPGSWGEATDRATASGHYAGVQTQATVLPEPSQHCLH